MAFIDFTDTSLQGLPAVAPARVAAGITPVSTDALSALERRIVELAREDRLSSLRPARRRSWLVRLVLGPQPPSPVLANDRLEALRRLAVQAWHHGYQLPTSALREAQSAGYSEVQVGAVVDMIARLRAPFRRLAA